MKERFTPRMYVDYFAATRDITVDSIGVAPIVILSWGQKVIASLAQTLVAKRSPNWFYDDDHIVYPLYSAAIGSRTVSLVQCPEGASATVMMMEELIACGATTFISLGWAGSLQSAVPVGTLLIPTECISEEGTSGHYMSSDVTLRPDPNLVRALLDAAQAAGVRAITGIQWTTDAPYRETVEKIADYRHKRVLGVDMETSAMYALGLFRKVRVCNMLVVSDELWGEWRPAFREPELRLFTQAAEGIVVDAVTRLFQEDSPE